MPLHLLGKKSWNVYNAANIARVKADEEAAAAREAAADERMQEIDAARRAAILRGQTPPPLPEERDTKDSRHRRDRDDRGHERKRRRLAGEDDTDMDIRLAASATVPSGGDKDEESKILRLRNTKIDAPLTDHAGNIDLFPVDMKEAIKREKNAEVEKEKRRKERAFEDQYTMRFSNAAGNGGLENPWYAAQQKPERQPEEDATALEYAGFENKNVWGNEDPRRKEREKARMTSNDPFAFMQQAQVQLKKSKDDKKKWAAERDRELRELRATQERDDRRSRRHKRKRKDEDVEQSAPEYERHFDRSDSKKDNYRHREAHSRSRDGSDSKSLHRHERRRSRSRSRSRERARDRHHTHSSSRRARDDRHGDRRRH